MFLCVKSELALLLHLFSFSILSPFQPSFPAGGGLSLSSISPSPLFLSLSHLVRQLWLARVQRGGKVWRGAGVVVEF